jgi:hypothetical protein
MYNHDDSQLRLTQENPQTTLIDGHQDVAIDAHLEWLENQAGQTISDLIKQKEKATQRLKAIEVEIDEIEKQIVSVKAAVSLIRKRNGIEPPMERQSIDANLNATYGGKGLRDALITFASQNNGIINESIAVETLMNAGLYPNYKKAKASINTTLNRESNPELGEPIFLKLDTGMYKLIES